MKIHYILPVLFAFGIATTSIQAAATGLAYDPYGNYYSKYYGIGAESTTQAADYYSKDDLLDDNDKVETVTSIEDADMANPLNYYKW